MPHNFLASLFVTSTNLQFAVFMPRKIIAIIQKKLSISSKRHWKVFLSQQVFWNISARSFKSTCEKVNLQKTFMSHELLHKWFLRFPGGIFSPTYLSTYLRKPVCVLYSTHILYLYSYLQKVLLPIFTSLEMESESKIRLSFWITFAAWVDQFV